MADFPHVELGKPDPIFGVAAKYNSSTLPRKELLSVGVYRDDEGLPYYFKVVQEAEAKNLHQHSKDYLPMRGYPPFISAAKKLLLGSQFDKVSSRVGTVQSIAGSGALFLVGRLVQNNFNCNELILPSPTWPNYLQIFGKLNYKINLVNFCKDLRFNLPLFLENLINQKDGQLLILQASAHNPTGIDPTYEDLEKIIEVAKIKRFILLFDFSYMGFASGDIDEDARFIRDLATTGTNFFVAFSFSKILGLYSERIGAVHAFCSNEEQANAIVSQLEIEVRSSWSNSIKSVAILVADILENEESNQKWKDELKSVCGRLISVRKKFVNLLNEKTGGDWNFIGEQKGMFCLTGLSKEEVQILGEREGIFIPDNGRLSFSSLNSRNIDFVAQGMANVINDRN